MSALHGTEHGAQTFLSALPQRQDVHKQHRGDRDGYEATLDAWAHAGGGEEDGGEQERREHAVDGRGEEEGARWRDVGELHRDTAGRREDQDGVERSRAADVL